MARIDFDKQTFTYTPESYCFYDSLPKPLRFMLWVFLCLYFGGAMIVPFLLMLRPAL